MAVTEHNVRLTSSEIASLWSGYMADSMAKQVLKYYNAKMQDSEIKPVLEYTIQLAHTHLDIVKSLFESEKFPVPIGFNEEDVNRNAPRLFSDTFVLAYLKNVAKQGLALYGISLAGSARADVRSYFTQCINSTSELYNRVTEIMLSKGLFVRSPYIPFPEAPEFVQKEGFLNGLLGDRRPLNVAEISHLYSNIQTNALGKALITGFAQCAKSDKIRDFFLRGKDIAHKQVEIFSSYLRDEDLPAPMTWDSDVLDSTNSPFSDKLMLFHITGLTAAGILNYGVALSISMRRDIAADYARLIMEIGTYSDDGAELMIENGWLEKPPGNVDRRMLAHQK